MQVKSIRATDYSSGSEYQYSDGSCNWQSIKAVDGQVNHQNTGSENLSASDNIVTSSSGTSMRFTPPLLLVVVVVFNSMTLSSAFHSCEKF